VVSAIEDPDARVAGQGHARLREAGIQVDVGLCRDEAARAHAGHFLRVREQRPYVTLKLAVSADGKIAAAGRKPVQITGEAASARVHLLRAQNDAILIGIGTAMADDPMLTCRLPGMEARSPVRVVLDRALRLSGNSRLIHSARTTPLWLIASETAEPAAATKLGAAGAHVFHLPADDHKPGLDLKAVLHTLSAQGITRLLVEGGAKVASSFLKAGLVDEFWLFQGAKNIGDDGLPALDGQDLETAVASGWLTDEAEVFGDDRLTIYRRVGSV
jgi:diaminohydroxyphosphoribosylaminopyrimidine deaminase/5-amino-6-(5-phosphoribosylamino)uracil reductase